jgi:hypothetical protein
MDADNAANPNDADMEDTVTLGEYFKEQEEHEKNTIAVLGASDENSCTFSKVCSSDSIDE